MPFIQQLVLKANLKMLSVQQSVFNKKTQWKHQTIIQVLYETSKSDISASINPKCKLFYGIYYNY